MDEITIEAGKKYYGFTCHHCQKPIACWEAHSGKLKFVGPGILRVKCLSCGEQNDFATDEVQVLEAHQEH